MAKGNNQKIKIMKIYDILTRYSDEEKPIKTSEIIERLKEEGIDCARKALYDDIKTLNDFGYEIQCVRKKQNEYYVIDRKFDVPELKFLIDAVKCSNFITEKKTKELIKKIAALSGTYKGAVLTRSVLYQNTLKRTNEKIYYTIDALERAIDKGKKVQFKYFDTDIHGNRVYRRDGEFYEVNPVKLTISDNKYYLICYNDKYANLVSYRVDRIDNISVLEKNKSFMACENDKAVEEYTTGLFSMFNGANGKTEVELKVKNTTSLAEIINDMFGTRKTITKEQPDYFYIRTKVVVGETFYAWLTTFKGDIAINFPSQIKDEYLQFLQANLNIYG